MGCSYSSKQKSESVARPGRVERTFSVTVDENPDGLSLPKQTQTPVSDEKLTPIETLSNPPKILPPLPRQIEKTSIINSTIFEIKRTDSFESKRLDSSSKVGTQDYTANNDNSIIYKKPSSKQIHHEKKSSDPKNRVTNKSSDVNSHYYYGGGSKSHGHSHHSTSSHHHSTSSHHHSTSSHHHGGHDFGGHHH